MKWFHFSLYIFADRRLENSNFNLNKESISYQGAEIDVVKIADFGLSKDFSNYKLGILPKKRKVRSSVDYIQNDFVDLVDKLEDEKTKQKKIKKELGWQPEETFETGIKKTVLWYLDNIDGWCKRVLDGSYRMERLGLGE